MDWRKKTKFDFILSGFLQLINGFVNKIDNNNIASNDIDDCI